MKIKVQGSDISGNAKATNILAPRFDINLDNQVASTSEAILDFGGGGPNGEGGNCISGAGIRINGYPVFMQNNWWGKPGATRR